MIDINLPPGWIIVEKITISTPEKKCRCFVHIKNEINEFVKVSGNNITHCLYTAIEEAWRIYNE